MVQKSNSFEKFWQELKRRKTIRVITVYAATAFIILQLVDIISKPLQLPEWTLTLVILLLGIGFIIATLLSWVYDITPSGVKKTESVSSVKHSDQTKPVTSTVWKIATYVSVIIIVALVAFTFVTRKKFDIYNKILEKSIAVLPFRNDSRDSTNQYFINGIMEMITTNLQMVKALRVVSRTSVEQYRNNKTKSVSEIAKELDVNYIIEGSGQKFGNSFSVTTQLIKAKGKETHLWAKTYEQEIKEVNDYIRIESQIAQLIATELKITITPEEKQLIEKTPTANLTAYDFYQRGREEHTKYWINNSDKADLQKAEDFYHKALKYDSAFAKAYAGLARAYWDKHYWQEYFQVNFMDSILTFTNIGLSFDNQLSEAYTLRGAYYNEIGKPEQANEEFDKAIKLNPNDWMAYSEKAIFYSNNDFVRCIDYRQKAASINRGPELPSLLGEIGDAYFDAGFPDKTKYYYQEAFALNANEAKYSYGLSYIEFSLGNFEEALKLSKKANEIDSMYLGDLMWFSTLSGHNEEAYICAKKLVEHYEKSGELNLLESHRVGYAFWKAGKIKEAEFYFNEQIDYSNRSIELKRSWAQKLYTYYDLAGVYAFRGEKDKAYKNLSSFNQIQRVPFWMTMFIKSDPLFDNIRNEPEFQQIERDLEAKYQAEHERVRKWLEETGQLL